MEFFAAIEEKWILLCDKTRPFRQGFVRTMKKIARAIRICWAYIYRLRAAFMAVPVGIAAVWLAIMNMSKLPQSVGIWLLTDGSYSLLVPREVAVFGPLAVTALGILLMLCSKKTVYPWLISIFTLVLPLMIFVTNVYPA